MRRLRRLQATQIVANVVRCGAAGENPVYGIQDAYLDYALIDGGGRPLDWREVAERLAGGRGDTIISAGGDGGLRPVLVADEDLAAAANPHPFLFDAVKTAKRTDQAPRGAAIYWTPIMRPYLFERMPYYADQYQKPLQERFGSVSILNLLRLPKSTSGEEEIEEVAAAVRALESEPVAAKRAMV